MKALKNVGSSSGMDVEVLYSDISLYFDKIGEDVTFSTYNGDFMPYIEPLGWSTDYWTGFYTSRPNLKALTF
jgi:hypothetical protein